MAFIKSNLIEKTTQTDTNSIGRLFLYLYDENIVRLNELLKGDFSNIKDVKKEKQNIPEEYFLQNSVFYNLRIKYQNYITASELRDTIFDILSKELVSTNKDYLAISSFAKRILIETLDSSQKANIINLILSVKNYCIKNNEFYDYLKSHYTTFLKNNKSREQEFLDQFKSNHYTYLEQEFWKFYEGVVNGKFNNINQCNIKKVNCN